MPGTITFRPVEANLTHDTNWLGKMDPYCKFSYGANHAQSSVCRHGGTRPHWGDLVNLPTTGLTGLAGAANVVRLEVFDKDRFRPDDHIAYTDIDLAELEQRGSISKWYPLYHKKRPAGEILIEAAIQQPPVVIQTVETVQTVVPTTYVQETIVSAPVDTYVGESYVVNEQIISETVQPVVQTEVVTQTIVEPAYTSVVTEPVIATQPHLASKTSFFGPAGGFPHGFHKLKGQTNAGYSERPGYTLGDVEANPTCQSNLDSNGGGFFNKPGREKRAEPYSLSNPGTYGIPHGQTIDTSGHLRPDVVMQRQAPIGTVNHPGITGYVDGYNPQLLNQSGLVQAGLAQPGLYNSGLAQPGLYNSGLNTGYAQPGLYNSTGLAQPGAYTTGLAQPGAYTTGLSTGLAQPGAYTTGYNNGLNQPNLNQGNF